MLEAQQLLGGLPRLGKLASSLGGQEEIIQVYSDTSRRWQVFDVLIHDALAVVERL